MKAVVLYNPGSAEGLLIQERPIPMPAVGQVVIRVKAFGLNRSELMTRKGLSPNVQFPRVLGIECVGEVEADPSGEFQKGQQIAACMGGMGRDFDGSYADYVVVPKSITYPFSSTLSWEVLGALPEMFQTVYGSLFLALDVKPGETLLIRGGTSSVGMMAAQLAKNAGLTVIATTRNSQKEKALRDNGASYVLIDDGKVAENVRALFPEGVDNVLELVGTTTLKDSLACIKLGGTGCMTGMLSENWSIGDFAPMEYIPATVRLTIYDSGQIRSSPSVFQAFIREVEAGQVKPSISQVFPLVKIVAAHQFMENNQGAGKLVVVP